MNSDLTQTWPVGGLDNVNEVIFCSDSMTDRYYTALYVKLLDPELKSSSKQSMFLNLVYKSMKSDPSDRRCKVSDLNVRWVTLM